MSSKVPPTASVSRHLAYHEIVERDSGYLYSSTVAKFREHLQRIRELQDLTMPNVQVSFDDGHISQFTMALPELQDAGIKAIFFITAGWTGVRENYMSWSQLAELGELGHEVAAHGWSHQLLTICSAPQLVDELRRPKLELESRLGKPITSLSAPGGRWSAKVLESAAEAGYQRFYTSDPWNLPAQRSGVELAGRWMVTRQMDADRIETLLRGTGFELQMLRVRTAAKEQFKALVGDGVYQQIWRTLARKQKSAEDSESVASTRPVHPGKLP